MAIDTEDKRRSLASVGPISLLPVPDGDISSEQDRRHIMGLYRIGPSPPGAMEFSHRWFEE